MKAANDFVCLRVREEKKGGFQVMADPSKNNIIEGEVVSIGEDVMNDFKIGKKVLFDLFKAIQHTSKGEKYYFVKSETIFAII